MLKKIFLTVAVVNFVALNIAVGYLVWQTIGDEKTLTNVENFETKRDLINTDKPVTGGEGDGLFVCEAECQALIAEKVSNEVKLHYSNTSPSPTTASAVKNTKTKFVSYIPIPGTGNTNNNFWTDIAGTEFSFSIGDYIGFKEAYFEVNIKLFNGNGIAYVRLYDITNSRAVDGSEISTTSQTSVAVSSGRISLWQGNNRYRIQARSLTADTTFFESGRLKIINEQ